MPSNTAHQVVAEALALRQSHPHAPATDVLALVLKGRDVAAIDFGELAIPPEPLGMLIAEACDSVMDLAMWRGVTGPDAPAEAREAVVRIWFEEVWPLFLAAY
jgi:hypothetical protein